ncbi:hypothetical protein RhiTH_011080 [Rhizoctonia solani]
MVVVVDCCKAALFLAISTGFVLESSKNLKPDQAVATAVAIQELASAFQAGFQIPAANTPYSAALASPENFKPSRIAVWVNCTPYKQAMRQQKAWDALQKWKFELFIEQLPTVMHIALTIPIGFTIVLYAALTVLPAWSPSFPMVTPFTRIMQAGNWYTKQIISWGWPKIQEYLPVVHLTRLMAPICIVKQAAKRHISIFLLNRRHQAPQSMLLSTGASPDQWILPGCRQSVGKTTPYACSEDQQSTFQALMWILGNSNNKVLINEVLDYVNDFPKVVLYSFASSQELQDATIVIAKHFQRLKHDAIEWHNLNASHFSAKCGRVMYLNSRPWLHEAAKSSLGPQVQGIYDCLVAHNPDMTTKEVEGLIHALSKQTLSPSTCTLWLERQAVKIVLGCPPEKGLKMCRALYLFVSSRVQIGDDYANEIYSTLSWMLLNTIIDVTSSGYSTFWPAHRSWSSIGSNDDDKDTPPVASCNSTLTLSYFRHSETRKESSQWLKIVGLSGMLNIPTFYLSGEIDIEPDTEENLPYYRHIIKLLHTTLSSIRQYSSDGDESGPIMGKLLVFWKSQVRLYEFDALQYCYDVLDRTTRYPRFLTLFDQLNELKNMIPRNRRLIVTPESSKSELSVPEATGPDLVEPSGPADERV